jgi:phospholipid/cholesterol/gamma-HCH transport system substrate-binding protein
MSERANNFKVGIFVIIGFCLFVAALFALGFKSSFGIKDVFETYIDGGVENLSVGAAVKLRGVDIGKVTSIKFISAEHPEHKQEAVLILFKVPRDREIIDPKKSVQENQEMLNKEIAGGLRARVQGLGFIGPSIVMLDYVNPKYYPVKPAAWTPNPKHYYIPSAPSQMEHVFASLENTLAHTEELDMGALVERTQKLIETANRLVTNINQIDFNNIGTNAGSFIVELRETNRGLQKTLADARRTLAVATNAIVGADLATVSRDTQAMEDHLSDAAIELRRTLASVDTGELNNSLANVRAATEELTVLLHNLKERPSAVLFSKPPHPASSVEPPARK